MKRGTRGPYKRYYVNHKIAVPASTQSRQRRQFEQLEAEYRTLKGPTLSTQPIRDTEKTVNFGVANRAAPASFSPALPNDYPDDNDLDGNYPDETTDTEISSPTEIKSVLEEVKTQQDMAAALLAIAFSNSLSHAALKDIADLWNLTSQVPFKLPTSFNAIRNKLTDQVNQNVTSRQFWYCSFCLNKINELAHSRQRQCPRCLKRLATYFHLDIEPQIVKIVKNNHLRMKSTRQTTGLLQDITDGNVYHRFRQQESRNTQMVLALLTRVS